MAVKSDRVTWFMMPGGRQDMIAKSPKYGPDVIIPCLEDGVAYEAEAKAEARNAIREATSTGFPREDVLLFPRINHPSGPYWEEDVAALVELGVDGIVIPKTESEEDVSTVSDALTEAEQRVDAAVGGTEIVCMVETPRGVWSALDIATAGDRVAGLLFGREDYAAGLGHMRRHRDSLADGSPELLYARSRVALAGSVAGVESIDGPAFTFTEQGYMNDDASLSARLGFTGKLAAHPAQLQAIVHGFTPLEEDLESARKIIELETAAHQEGRAAVGAVDGMEVTPPIVDQARLLLARKSWSEGRG